MQEPIFLKATLTTRGWASVLKNCFRRPATLLSTSAASAGRMSKTTTHA